MATRGKPLDVSTIRSIKRAREVLSIRATAKELRVSRMTVRKYAAPSSSQQTRK